MSHSKSLTNSDQSGFDFSKEMLAGDPTFGINFDRVQWDNTLGKYVIVEYLLCDERQFVRNITPFSSHPNKYFNINPMKFISLWEISQQIPAKLILVNYSKSGTEYENQVKVMDVINVDKSKVMAPVTTIDRKMTRNEFSTYLRDLNMRGRKI